MTIRIRTAAAGDIPAMHRIRTDVRENRLSDASRITEDSYVLSVEQGCAWVAEVGSAMVGFGALDISEQNVWALFVSPGAEGTGVGRALLDRVERAARERGIGRLALTTAPGTRAELFYARAGWTKAGLSPEGEVRFEKDPGA